ncbi:MAG: sensor histidine kinase [Christensenellaceae bacterium]|nr:sensor histidine kinase [Christensenellaceae bacterium]
MRGLIRHGVFRSLRVQLLFSMVLLITIPLIAITLFGNYFYAQAFDEQATSYARQMLRQVQTNIDANLRAVDQIITYLSLDEDVLKFLRLSDFYAPSRVEVETASRLKMQPFVQENRGLISGILIANERNLYVSSEMFRIARYPMVQDGWYQAARARGGERVLLSKPIGRNIRNIHNPSADDIVSVARAVLGPETGEVLGVIMVDMCLSAIENHIQDLTLGKSGYVFVMDDAGQVVYAPVNPTVYRIQHDWVEDESPEGSVHTLKGERYQLFSTRSRLAGWRTVGAFKSGEVLGPVQQLRGYTLMLALLGVLVASLTAITFSASFTRPISKLRMLMAETERGNLDVSFTPRRDHGEIAQLAASFNNMMEKIRSLLQLVYVEQKNKREAEVKTLQAQIKPHFLYNTLDTIRWMAEERGAIEIVQMVSALTKLFRIGLSRGKEVIPLSEEIEHVRCYLFIQQVRYEDKLDYEIHADEDCLSDRVNKLILQPLVENAIYHGIKQKRGAGHIAVGACERDGKLILTVRDNGAGMTGELCDQLNAALRTPGGARDAGHGYGIFNVNDRIRLSHGDEYALHYAINESGGVTVTIAHPIIRDEEGVG